MSTFNVNYLNHYDGIVNNNVNIIKLKRYFIMNVKNIYTKAIIWKI